MNNPNLSKHQNLSRTEVTRYSRHLMIPEVGMEGQQKLKMANVLIVGVGGLGSPVGLYLAAAGIGKIGLVDFDVVDMSNLQRQIVYDTPNIGRAKLQCACERLKAINPEVQIELYDTRLSSANALEIISKYDVIVDGTDNFPTRYLVNDACVLANKPNVYASIFRFEGQATVMFPPQGPCYRCLYPVPPPPGEIPNCAEGGVLGILPGLVGCIQATEAVKLILCKGSALIGRLLLYDALEMRFQELKIQRNPSCPICGNNPTITHLIDYEQFCGVPDEKLLGGNQKLLEITAIELHERLKYGESILILDVRTPEEYQICHIPGSTLIPFQHLSRRYLELDKCGAIVVYCKSGIRSARAVELLLRKGFTNLKSLRGGILAWGESVDASLPKY